MKRIAHVPPPQVGIRNEQMADLAQGQGNSPPASDPYQARAGRHDRLYRDRIATPQQGIHRTRVPRG
jgi:hypothetical protein